MTTYENRISTVLERQPVVALLSLAALILYGVWVATGIGASDYQPAGLLPHAVETAGRSVIKSAVINISAVAISSLFLWMINRWYYITHSYCRIYLGLYIIGLASIPALWHGLSSGLIMCAVLLFCVIMLYSLYQRPGGTRRIFLVFCLISVGSLYDFAYLGFAIPLMLACGQMRCMSLRAVLAAGIGLITPLWIGQGFGLIDLTKVGYPMLSIPTLSLLDEYPIPIQILMAAVVIITSVLTIVNTFTIYGHNAKTRANNGVLALMSLWSALAIVIDFAHALSYLPILIALMSVQVALCFSLRRKGRGYITVIVSILLFLSCAVWQMISI
ncbi:MAG: hypothetical protein K2K79_01335 [Paramuribaculum sp.]|nr:hypothetical protein [Paramuribaculum sp.]